VVSEKFGKILASNWTRIAKGKGLQRIMRTTKQLRNIEE